jgi:hypothetical protein
LTLTPEAPGEYVGQFTADKLGSYLVSVAEPGANGQSRVETTGFSQPYPVELRTFRTNTALLERLRQATGGQILVNPADALKPVRNPGNSIAELWLLFLIGALVLLPLDIAVRRLALPIPEMIAALGQAIRGAPNRVRTRQQPSATAPAHVSRLKDAKQRVNRVTSAPPPAPVGEAPTVVAPAPPQPQEPSEPEPVGATKSAGDRLLEAKRRRRGE